MCINYSLSGWTEKDSTDLVRNPKEIQYTSRLHSISKYNLCQMCIFILIIEALYDIQTPNFRWNRQKGKTISSNNEFWFTNEPNIKEFDYATRKICPVTKKAYEACSSNPTSSCSISTSFRCDQRPDPSTATNSSFM